MIRAVCVLALAAAGAAQATPLFQVVGRGGGAVVSANRAAVACDRALEELAAALGWSLRIPADGLREQLAARVVDLSIVERAPQIVAGTIAAAAGAEVVVVEHSGTRPFVELAVVGLPDATTDAGRARLRHWALAWYRECLSARILAGGDGDDESLRVRMRIAELLAQRGEHGDAAVLLEQVVALAPEHRFVPQALLRMAECWFELGPDTWVEAERRARDLMRLHPSRPEAAAGTVLLGRILLASDRAAECAATLEKCYLRLADAPEIVDVYLIVAMAYLRLGDATAVTRVLATLDGGHQTDRLRGAPLREYLFLSGYAAQRRGMPRRAARSLEQWFALAPADDPLRGEAFVLLGQAYFDDGRYLQAHAAALHARRPGFVLDRTFAEAAARLHAAAALALGEGDRVIDELAAELRRESDDGAELTLHVAELLRARGRYSRCVDLLEGWITRPGVAGDRARTLAIRAWSDEARTTGDAERLLARGPGLAAEIEDPALQREAATMLGDAYTRLGDPLRAADAYQGVLR